MEVYVSTCYSEQGISCKVFQNEEDAVKHNLENFLEKLTDAYGLSERRKETVRKKIEEKEYVTTDRYSFTTKYIDSPFRSYRRYPGEGYVSCWNYHFHFNVTKCEVQ